MIKRKQQTQTHTQPRPVLVLISFPFYRPRYKCLKRPKFKFLINLMKDICRYPLLRGTKSKIRFRRNSCVFINHFEEAGRSRTHGLYWSVLACDQGSRGLPSEPRWPPRCASYAPPCFGARVHVPRTCLGVVRFGLTRLGPEMVRLEMAWLEACF